MAGEVAEWLNAPVSKIGMGASSSGVRIPPSPPNPKRKGVIVTKAPPSSRPQPNPFIPRP